MPNRLKIVFPVVEMKLRTIVVLISSLATLLHLCVCTQSLSRSVAQSCPTLCDPMDCSLLGSSVHGICEARILEWVAISFSRNLPHPGIKPLFPALAGGFFTTEQLGGPWTETDLEKHSDTV